MVIGAHKFKKANGNVSNFLKQKNNEGEIKCKNEIGIISFQFRNQKKFQRFGKNCFSRQLFGWIETRRRRLLLTKVESKKYLAYAKKIYDHGLKIN